MKIRTSVIADPDTESRPATPRQTAPETATVEPVGQTLFGRAAQMSHLIYADQTEVRARLASLGATHITDLNHHMWKRPNVVAFGFVLDRRAWIVFRGSDDWNDWAANLAFVPGYHIGFGLVWNVLREATHAFAAQVRDAVDGLVLTGHSLGGGIATLATLDIAKAGHPVEALITFGAPRVGSLRFARRFRAQGTNRDAQTLDQVATRFSTSGEIVSRVPFFFLGFWHVGHEAPLEDAAGAMSILLDWPVLRAFRKAFFDTMVPFALPLLLPFVLVFALDRYFYHRMDSYLRHFHTAPPLLRLDAPETLPGIRARSSPLAVVYVLMWIIGAGVLLWHLTRLSFQWSGMAVPDMLWLCALLVFTRTLEVMQSGRLQP